MQAVVRVSWVLVQLRQARSLGEEAKLRGRDSSHSRAGDLHVDLKNETVVLLLLRR